MNEPIDRKFTFCATSCEHGHEYSHMDAMVFLAKDKALPETLGINPWNEAQDRAQNSSAT